MALRFTTALVLLASLTARTSAQNDRNCWYPDGRTETADIPCNPNAAESACCSPDAFCLSNGLCLYSGVVSRGSCTDRDWSDPACATQCTNENTDNGLTLMNCDALDGTWICAINGNSCDNDAVVFNINSQDMNQIALRPIDAQSSPLLLKPSSIINNASSSSDGNSTTTNTVTVTPSTSSDATAHFTTGQMAGVGAGVGVPLLLCLLGAIFVITRQRERLRAAEAYGKENELNPTGRGHSQMPYDSYSDPHKIRDTAAYYRPISPAPPVGHFRELVPVSEMEGASARAEMEVPK